MFGGTQSLLFMETCGRIKMTSSVMVEMWMINVWKWSAQRMKICCLFVCRFVPFTSKTCAESDVFRPQMVDQSDLWMLTSCLLMLELRFSLFSGVSSMVFSDLFVFQFEDVKFFFISFERCHRPYELWVKLKFVMINLWSIQLSAPPLAFVTFTFILSH
jgi:hypothetical protein